MAEDNEVFIEDDAVVLEDTDDTDVVDARNSLRLFHLLWRRYNRAEDYRRQDETRWLRAYRNYRGIYGLMFSLQKQKSLVSLLR